jgi:Phage tail fibre repeat
MMAELPETPEWTGVYQIEVTDPVAGGAPNRATGGGMSNIPHQDLAKRTAWLKVRVDTLDAAVVDASTLVAGIVRLSSAINSNSTTLAATPSAVKAAYDLAATKAATAITVTGGGLATGGGDLSANRTISVADATQAEAEAGTITTKAMSPLRVAQAIAARLLGRSVLTSGLATGGGNLSADRTIAVPVASQAQAEAGTDNVTAMTPLRVAQAITEQVDPALAAKANLSGATFTGAVSASMPATTAAWVMRAKTAGVANDSGLYVDSANNFELALRDSAGALKVRIGAIGPMLLNGDAGTTGEVMLSQGAGAAPIWGKPAIDPDYTSSLQTITDLSLLTLAHGLSVKPRLVEIRLSCAVAQSPYAVGEEATPIFYAASGDIKGTMISYDATNIKIRTGNNLLLVNNSGALLSLTNASWRYIVRAWK